MRKIQLPFKTMADLLEESAELMERIETIDEEAVQRDLLEQGIPEEWLSLAHGLVHEDKGVEERDIESFVLRKQDEKGMVALPRMPLIDAARLAVILRILARRLSDQNDADRVSP